MVIIGIDPYPSSHTAVALDHNGTRLSQLTVVKQVTVWRCWQAG